MKVWYQSEKRFRKKIIKRWIKRGFKYHTGHINILRYAYRTATFWEMVKENKVSLKNKSVVHPTLF